MYVPEHFAEPDVAVARSLIEAHSFGTLIVPRPGGVPDVAHIPFVLDAGPAPLGTLRAHVARANPIGALLANEIPVLAVFTGPHAYVSPRWYEAPRKNVPTWNFTAVHAHGIARRIDAREDKLRALADLTSKHETDPSDPWNVEMADRDYVERLLGGIVAFSISIERFETKMKLSQNRPQGDRLRVIERLRERRGPDDEAIAAMIEANEHRRR
jgi:transcriptional regulator